MFILQVTKDSLKVLQRETIVTGSDYDYRVQFNFSDDWEGLGRQAVFKVGSTCKTINLDTDICSIPPEVLRASGQNVIAGVRGFANGETEIAAVWTSLNRMPLNSGSGSSIPSSGVKPSGNNGTTSGGNTGGSTTNPDPVDPNPPIVDPNPDNPDPDNPTIVGTTDHSKLTNRSAANQHPISAITGLQEKLNTIPVVKAMTAKQLQDILKS